MHARRSTWLTWSCIFSSMWLQPPVVDSLWFLVTVPALHLSEKEAQLLPTMSHGYDNTIDTILGSNDSPLCEDSTLQNLFVSTWHFDSEWSSLGKLWRYVKSKTLTGVTNKPFKTDMQSPWLKRLMNKDNQYKLTGSRDQHGLSTNGCRLGNSKFPIQDCWCWQHTAKLYLQTLARNVPSDICKWELLQPVIQNKNHIVLPAAVNINSPRSSDCHW